jgi:hypothetical protein
MYRAALEDLRQANCHPSDQRWHSALARVHRDWADLLSASPERTEEASNLLQQAVAIHAFQGRRSQLAYCHTTAARIAFSAKCYIEAAQTAMDAANIFEHCQNWRGWTEPLEILLLTLAEMRDAVRMQAVTELAVQKIAKSNLPPDKKSMETARLRFRKAEALWIAGNLDEARHELSSLSDISFGLQNDFERLKAFLRIA